MMSHVDRTKRIRTILVKDWDPLGVSDNQNLTDEYDATSPVFFAWSTTIPQTNWSGTCSTSKKNGTNS